MISSDLFWPLGVTTWTSTCTRMLKFAGLVFKHVFSYRGPVPGAYYGTVTFNQGKVDINASSSSSSKSPNDAGLVIAQDREPRYQCLAHRHWNGRLSTHDYQGALLC